VGGVYVVLTKVAMNAIGITGLPAFTIVKPNSIINYGIGLVIALVVSFVVTYVLGIEDKRRIKYSIEAIKLR
jgi:phosphotransferase system  glucose/maltose/N-acetylglucosamine-specific IIC component